MVKKIAKAVAVILILTVPIVGWTQRWNLYDSWRLRNYTPPKEIAQLAADTTMNDGSKRLFYVFHPELNDKSSFNKNCTSSEQTIVLGCYVEGRGIYLFNVTDQRLTGVQQVTAAHELLHAAYGRLSGNEKKRVDTLLNKTFDQLKDERIRRTVEDYRAKGADINNELHSILGTEVRDLPDELEAYYTRYFTDRKKIVSYSEQYEKAFSERKDKVAAYDKTLESLRQQIDAGEASLSNQEGALTAERQRLDALLAAKDYQSYNAGVPSFNRMVNTYNAQVGHVRALIDQYNTIVSQRNALVDEEDQLVKAIDSRPETVKTH